MEITDGQSWPNYIGPKRDIPQVCLTRPVFTPFPLKVAWSGISFIVCIAGKGWQTVGTAGSDTGFRKGGGGGGGVFQVTVKDRPQSVCLSVCLSVMRFLS